MPKDQSALVSTPAEPAESQPAGLDQPFHAAIARMTGGLSPLALGQAYADWQQHLLLSPDKQTELVHKAERKWQRLLGYCARACASPECPSCIEPLPQDKRFLEPIQEVRIHRE